MVAARPDRGGGAVDGRVSREFSCSDAERRGGARRACGACRPGKRFATHGGPCARICRTRGGALMSYATMLTIALPEIVLSLGALTLMLAAAWGGQAAARPVCWAALVVLVGAGHLGRGAGRERGCQYV